MGFKEDMRLAGRPAEKVAQAIARDKFGACSTRRPNNTYRHDLELTYPVEVKNEQLACVTGNIFIETYNPYQGAPSGLATTDALSYWFFSFNERKGFDAPMLYTVRTKDLKNLIDANKDGFAKYWKERAGDNNSNGYAVPIRVMKDLLGRKFKEVPLEEKYVALYQRFKLEEDDDYQPELI